VKDDGVLAFNRSDTITFGGGVSGGGGGRSNNNKDMGFCKGKLVYSASVLKT